MSRGKDIFRSEVLKYTYAGSTDVSGNEATRGSRGCKRGSERPASTCLVKVKHEYF